MTLAQGRNDLFDSPPGQMQMTSLIRRRIEKLEEVNVRLVHRCVWEDGTGSAEQQIARIKASGELDDDKNVTLHIVHWRTPEAIAAANELMRKRKATRDSYGAEEP